MEPNSIDLHGPNMEQSFLKMSENLAVAVESSQKAKDLATRSEILLIRIHQELEELYMSVGSACELEK